MEFDKEVWLIWSNEHGAWWRPGSMGYTRWIEQAGRYKTAEAAEIVTGANRYLPKGKTHEAMVLSPEACADLINV